MTTFARLSITTKNMNSTAKPCRRSGITPSTVPIKAIRLLNLDGSTFNITNNIDKAAEDEKSFDRKLIAMRKELESGRHVPEHESLYKKYFEVKEEAVCQVKRYYGYSGGQRWTVSISASWRFLHDRCRLPPLR